MIASEGIKTRAFAILLAGSLAALGQQPEIEPRARPQPNKEEVRRGRIRIDTTLVLVPVEVSDRLGRPVGGLEKKNFHVFDDNVEQTIVSFATEDEPIAVCLVFDVSGSMAGDLPAMRQAAAQFFRTSNPGDEFCLVELANDVHLAVPLTEDAAAVDYQLMLSQTGGRTALLDGVYMGLNAVKKSRNLRKALVIISDVGENHSRYTPHEVRNAIVESGVLIYAIGAFGNGMGSNYDDQIVLRQLTEQTGGRMFGAAGRLSLADFADKIVIDLRNRYLLGYAPIDMPRDGRYHHITVKLAPPRGLPKLHAHWRTGYYAPSE